MMLQRRRSYLLRPVHVLAYLLDRHYVDSTNMPGESELGEATYLMMELARAHDVRAEMRSNELDKEEDLPPTFPTPTKDGVEAEFFMFRAKAGGSFRLPMVWRESAMADGLCWWTARGRHQLHLQLITKKVLKLPTSLSAGERAFSNAGFIQSVLRTLLTYQLLHRMLMVYFNYRMLKGADCDVVDPVVSNGESEGDSDGEDWVGRVIWIAAQHWRGGCGSRGFLVVLKTGAHPAHVR